MVICTVVLGASAGWGLSKIDKKLYYWITAVFAAFAIHASVELLTCCGALGGLKLYLHTAFIAEVLHIPFLNTELYKQMGMKNVALGHAASCIVPFISLYVLWDRKPGLTDFFDIVNTASLIYLAVKRNNEWCGFIALNHIVFRMYGYYSAIRLSMLSLGFSIFTILAVHCLMDPPEQTAET